MADLSTEDKQRIASEWFNKTLRKKYGWIYTASSGERDWRFFPGSLLGQHSIPEIRSHGENGVHFVDGGYHDLYDMIREHCPFDSNNEPLFDQYKIPELVIPEQERPPEQPAAQERPAQQAPAAATRRPTAAFHRPAPPRSPRVLPMERTVPIKALIFILFLSAGYWCFEHRHRVASLVQESVLPVINKEVSFVYRHWIAPLKSYLLSNLADLRPSFHMAIERAREAASFAIDQWCTPTLSQLASKFASTSTPAKSLLPLAASLLLQLRQGEHITICQHLELLKQSNATSKLNLRPVSLSFDDTVPAFLQLYSLLPGLAADERHQLLFFVQNCTTASDVTIVDADLSNLKAMQSLLPLVEPDNHVALQDLLTVLIRDDILPAPRGKQCSGDAFMQAVCLLPTLTHFERLRLRLFLPERASTPNVNVSSTPRYHQRFRTISELGPVLLKLSHSEKVEFRSYIFRLAEIPDVAVVAETKEEECRNTPFHQALCMLSMLMPWNLLERQQLANYLPEE